MDKIKNGKYQLICVINNNMNCYYTFKSGSIEEIDKYIFDKKIKNPDDLYNDFTNEYWQGSATYTFKLIYKYKGIKEKPILYYHDINKINNLNVISDIGYNYFNNIEYFNFFIDKYVIPLLNINDDNNIKKYANNLYYNQRNRLNFDKFIYALISKNTSKFDTKKEIYYTKLRNMYCDLKYLNTKYENPTIEDEAIEITDTKVKRKY